MRRRHTTDSTYTRLAQQLETAVWTLDGPLASNAGDVGLPVTPITWPSGSPSGTRNRTRGHWPISEPWPTVVTVVYHLRVRIVGASSEAEMVACFLRGELNSARFGAGVRRALTAADLPEQLVADPDLTDADASRARRDLLGATRGYGRNRDLFDEDFPATVSWKWALLSQTELALVRYVYYAYWNELSGGTRLSRDAAGRIRAGRTACGVTNDRFLCAAQAYADGALFPPLILAGTSLTSLVCLEGNLRLTAMALAGFPSPARCLVGTDPALEQWTH